MKKTIFRYYSALAFISIATVTTLHAQVTTFKLADYKYRTPLYRSLQLDLDLSQGVNSQSKAATTTNYEFDGLLDFDQTVATDLRQHLSSYAMYLQTSGRGTKQNGVKRSDGSFSPGANFLFQERRFRSNYYIEYGGGAGFNLTSQGNKDSIKRSERNFDANISGSIGIGRGRLEYVQDAQTALYILEDLQKEGLIRSQVPAEVANRLAQLITTTKRTRVIDQRRRIKYQLVSIDSFLRKNGIIREWDSRTSAIVNDNLFYGFTNDLSGREYTYGREMGDLDFNRELLDEGEGNDFGMMPFLEPVNDQFFRRHGTVMYAHFSPRLSYQSMRRKIGDSVVEDPFGPDPSVLQIIPAVRLGYEKREAVSLQWQKAAVVQLDVEKTFAGNDYRYLALRLRPSYSLGYYPNNRTVVEGEGALNLSYYSLAGSGGFEVAPELNFRAGYFISYRTVLRATFRLEYNRSGGTSPNSFNQSLRIILRHYLF